MIPFLWMVVEAFTLVILSFIGLFLTAGFLFLCNLALRELWSAVRR